MIATERFLPMRTPDWFNEINFAFSLKSDGQMSLKRAPLSVVTANRRRFLQANGLELDSVVAGELVHGSAVKVITLAERGRGAKRTDWIECVDGLVTAEAGLLMLTTHADCMPVVVYDAANRVIGQAHAGWRSLRSGIIENLITTIRSVNPASKSSLYAWVGPTIRACCYPVGEEVARQFPQECRVLVGERIALDLTRFIQLEFARLNLDPLAITDSGICTACDPTFASFRRDGDKTVAMALVTGL